MFQKPFLAEKKSSWPRRAPSDLKGGRAVWEMTDGVHIIADQVSAVHSNFSNLTFVNELCLSIQGIPIIISTPGEGRAVLSFLHVKLSVVCDFSEFLNVWYEQCEFVCIYVMHVTAPKETPFFPDSPQQVELHTLLLFTLILVCDFVG